MNSKDRANLIKRISTIEGLTDNERSALLGLLRENKSYGLVWEDKPEDIEERLRDELPILTEVPERAIISEDKDAPNHILIEGDNLETLATLAYTHEGKIDIIYIDPPYNTGNKDFIYNDSYVDKEDSYRHSKWLSFMSRRLKIAKKLLSDRGVIFISIDDNEQAQLKLLCDETFGENNFLSEIMWHKNYASANDSKTFSKVLDYILAYRKTDKFIRNLLPRTEKQNTLYKYDSNDGKGKWRSDNLSVRTYSANYDFPIVNPITGVEYNPPKGRSWMTNKERIQEWITETRVYFGLNGKGAPQLKRYLSEVQQGVVPTTYWSYDDCGHNDEARKEIKDIFGQPPFDSPKPTRLLKQILRLGSNNESIILDFFAGSGTTLHATMQLNSEDGGHRKCILVTNNENNICEEVTYERNRRVIQGYTNAKGEEVPGLIKNSLRYYRTGFVGRSRSMQNMRKLVNLATDMLCIKEDLYTEQTTFGEQKTHKGVFRYFDDGNKKMLIIYREEVIDELVDIIYDMDVDQPIKVYVFSPSEDPWEGSFEDVSDKVELCALPQAIYNTYRRILPKKKDAVVMPEDDALATTEKEEEQFNGMLNFEYDEEA
ncbi:site-specific DNA-methyltransferase [Phocaeicola vulgatus]|jgi:adenine-specific DNA-methyltransferase|uniref:site-specific DNA-methyltransferase n=1 Tax=Phocaeicola vulgatus TaxID=821 RepID=UPI000E5574BF|nr:site-specific DNA-methyltransferase [Phocaeicola vulgatus]RGQ23478.1 site-specific DNA-methyltransferase [Phocaeicola vulgatus]